MRQSSVSLVRETLRNCPPARQPTESRALGEADAESRQTPQRLAVSVAIEIF